MDTQGSKKSAADSEDDETETLNPKSVERLVMAFSESIQTAITTGFVAATAAATSVITSHHSAATTTNYTSAIYPYDNQLFNVDNKEGKYQWVQVTKIREVGTPISVTVVNAETILGLFKDRYTQYGLDHIINVPTTGIGRVKYQARTSVGIDYHNADLGNLKKLLKDIHAITTDHV